MIEIRQRWERVAGVLLVAALHAAALWGAWSHRLISVPPEATTLFVNFIAPPPPARLAERPRREPPKSRQEEKPPPRTPVAEAPIISPAEAAVPPAPTSVMAAPVEPLPPVPAVPAGPVGPMALSGELSVSCPERAAPNYPMLSRRMNETGIAVLRVELDEQGRVAAARIATGSGYSRLDEAALAAVKTWRCTPAQRNGQPVRAVALQPFKFVLQGS